MNALAAAALLLLLAPDTPIPADAVKVEGPAVIFISPVGPTGDAIRSQMDRLREELGRQKIKAVEATPTLILLGDEDNPRKRVRQVDFRRTPRFTGTLVFVESYDPQIRQGLEDDQKLLERLAAFLGRAKKAKEEQP
jgi:hypothetical protein